MQRATCEYQRHATIPDSVLVLLLIAWQRLRSRRKQASMRPLCAAPCISFACLSLSHAHANAAALASGSMGCESNRIESQRADHTTRAKRMVSGRCACVFVRTYRSLALLLACVCAGTVVRNRFDSKRARLASANQISARHHTDAIRMCTAISMYGRSVVRFG